MAAAVSSLITLSQLGKGGGGETVVLTPPSTSPASPIRRGSGHGNVTPDEILINTLNHNEIAAANTEIREEPFYY